LISGGNAAKSSIDKPPKNQSAAIALAASVTAYDPALVPNVFTNIGMKIAPYLEVIELNGLAGANRRPETHAIVLLPVIRLPVGVPPRWGGTRIWVQSR
jgi:hypothetical protein